MIFEIIVVLLLSQLLLGVYLWYQVKDFYKYPNLLGFPVIGNLYYFYKSYGSSSLDPSYRYQQKIAEKYGDGMCFTFMNGRRTVLLSCPHITEKIAYHPNLVDKAPEVYGVYSEFLSGIFSQPRSDSEWKLRRKEMNKSLTKNRIEGPYHEDFVRLTKNLVETIATNPQKFDPAFYLTIFTINVVKGTLCGIKELLPLNRTIYRVIEMLTHNASRGMATPIYGFVFFQFARIFDRLFMSATDELRKQVFGAIRQDIKKIEKCYTEEYSNLPLSMVIALRNKERNLKIHHLQHELYELVIVGTHTVTIVLTNALACLAVFPQIQEKAWKEQYEIFGSNGRDPTVEDIKRMSYLERLLKETLRFFSAAVIMKWTTGEINIGGAEVPAGTHVYMLLHKMRMDPRYWKNPQVFDPDRFLEEDRRPKYSFAPFGVGIRSCPGMSFSMNEMKIALSGILRRFKLTSNQKFEDLKYEFQMMTEISNLSFQIEERKYFG